MVGEVGEAPALSQPLGFYTPALVEYLLYARTVLHTGHGTVHMTLLKVPVHEEVPDRQKPTGYTQCCEEMVV